MATVTVEGIATEFLRLIEEGWSPDLEEFLGRVPEDLREECRQRIEELSAATAQPESAADADEPIVHSAAEEFEVLAEAEAALEAEPIEEPPEESRTPTLLKGVHQFDLMAEPETAAEVGPEPEAVEEPEAPVVQSDVEELEPMAEEEAAVEPVSEPEVVEEIETPKPSGLRRLSKEEAMAMFREMELKRAREK
jgi:hypothetical protein